MGVLDLLYRKKKNSSITTENKIEYTNENKVENSLDNLPTDEQIRSVASIGLHTIWLTGISNENLIPMMFEWIDIDCYKKILRFKTLRSNRINYAPCAMLFVSIARKMDIFLVLCQLFPLLIIRSCCHLLS